MNKRFNIFLIALIGMIGCALSGCDDDKATPAKAVLASASNMTFDPTAAEGQLITVYADASWTCEHPDWISVTPDNGTGSTDVMITVSDNLRDGAIDNPRKGVVVFKGVTKESEAHVTVRQLGDNFRDMAPISIPEMEKLEEEAIAIVNDVTVTTVLNSGFVATDGTNNMLVQYAGDVTVGEAVNVKGAKGLDDRKMSIMIAEKVEPGTTVSALPTPVDITDKLDDYSSDTRTYITMNGLVDGQNIVVEGQSNKIAVTDAAKGIAINELNGHMVTITGYYGGTATPAVNVIIATLVDNGLREVIYYQEDFEWLDPWAEAGSAGKTVENDDLNATAPQIKTPKVDDVSALQALERKGYVFHRVTTKTAGECIYLQRNYLKFGKTSYQAGVSLPKISGIPAGDKVKLSFDWCPMRQGSGKVDPVNLIVIVNNGGVESTYEVPTHGWENGHKLEWIRAEVDLSMETIDNNTVITIRQTQWPAATANRWFLDNIKVSQIQ